MFLIRKKSPKTKNHKRLGGYTKMFFYTKYGVTILSIVITIVLMVCFIVLIPKVQWLWQEQCYPSIQKLVQSFYEVPKEQNNSENTLLENTEANHIEEILPEEKLAEYEWGLFIPKIDLIAPIQEGTSKEIMNQAVGHFENTAIEKGNVGLAAHNRGYLVNYFQNLKKLQLGDIVYYKYNQTIREYEVDVVTIIRDDDWSYLEDTEENRLTLITCVENEPSYRRCIQAVERKKE